ncbi:recombinase RecT [Methylobacterium sp. sgz302541]|uniref:recombinase RecT n=1 Tax=unclassified Methylobacterium TaxID=2615210 RepID=UPI003D328E09
MSAGNALSISDTERRIAERIDPETTRRLAVSDAAGGLSFVDMAQVMEFAKLMAVSAVAVPKHLRGNPGACVAVVMQAVEWRMSPYAVANKSYSVNDRLAYESQLVQAVILQRAPIKGRFKVEYFGEGDRRKCRVTAALNDGSGETVSYESPEFGKIQPKNSPLWKTDPDQQQFYYSGRALCRRHFPDVLLGVYAKDELEDAGRDPAQARDVSPPKGLDAKLDALAAKPKPAERAPVDDFVDMTTAAQAEDQVDEARGEQAPADDQATAPQIDAKSPDYALGYEGGIQGMRKGLTAQIKADPVRLANYEAGHAAGVAQSEKED